MNEEYIGIVDDPRSEEEKQKDYQHAEIASFTPYLWEEREPKKFPIFNQDGSSACVAFATAKILGIDEVAEGREFVHLSPRFIYTKRENQGGGMWLPNALDIARKFGSCKEEFVPSENRNEAQMNFTGDISKDDTNDALDYRSLGFIELPLDMDTIAGIIGQDKGVLFGFTFDYDEWTDTPTINPSSKDKCRHGVAGVDAVLKNGKRYIVIDDSWGPNHTEHGQRYISEEFLKAKCFYAGYTLNLIFEIKFEFTKNMRFGDRNSDVKELQNRLAFEGFFPTNVDFTGYFGAITKKAVMKYQEKNKLQVDGIVGPKTITYLNGK